MTDEEKILKEEKTREKYFYVDKERTYQVLTGIVTSFIGAGLALVLFAALHKPPVPPCPMMQFNQPKPCPMKIFPQNIPHKMFPDGGKFRNFGEHRIPREFNGKKFPPRPNFEGRRPEDWKVNAPLPPQNEQIPTPKR